MTRSLSHRLVAAGSATIHEAQNRTGALGPAVRPMWPGAAAAGPAFTVQIPPGDNLGVHLALEHTAQGDFLVVTSASWTPHGFWGAVLTEYAIRRGVVGLITDLFVRDTEAIHEMGFPVFARGRSILGTAKQASGWWGQPITIGQALVQPGDWLVGDADGCVVVKREHLGEVAKAAESRVAKERAAIERIRAGESTRDSLGF